MVFRKSSERQKDLGLEGCGRRMSDTWSPEIQKFTYGVIFKSLICWRLNELKKVKRVGWILPSGRKLPHRRLQSSLSELQSPPWFRSTDLGFGCSAGSDSNFGCLRVFARIYGAGFSNYARIWSVYFESDSEWKWCSVLMRVASSLNFVGSWILMKPDAVPSAFWGWFKQMRLRDNKLH